MTNPAQHGIACQTISWQTSFSGLLAYVFKPDKPSISRKIGSRAYSLRQTEVLIVRKLALSGTLTVSVIRWFSSVMTERLILVR
ncbi:hypothetical protein [Candidatus Midichloria mitochondrii]|uniref:hypothetical protein n=1 Tax=Candidatus Midichloria mitochondrii TaxID=234827 RepID=UPI00135F1815|nr:hypothetical protein [Candidatus Midichloria mitochondrii]